MSNYTPLVAGRIGVNTTFDQGSNAKILLLEQLSLSEGKYYNPQLYMFVNPRYDSTQTGYNTAVDLFPSVQTYSIGKRTIYYNRISVSSIRTLTCQKGSAVNVSDLLSVINNLIGIRLTSNDITDQVLPDADSNGNISFNLTASENSLIIY